MTSLTAAPFGRLLRQHRLAAGLSQEKLAERAGLSARGIRALERGDRSLPHPHTLRLLADCLGLADAERAAALNAARQQLPPPNRLTPERGTTRRRAYRYRPLPSSGGRKNQRE